MRAHELASIAEKLTGIEIVLGVIALLLLLCFSLMGAVIQISEAERRRERDRGVIDGIRDSTARSLWERYLCARENRE